MCLYEPGTFFIPSRQGGIPLEIDGIPTKVGQKCSYKCLMILKINAYSPIMWLKVANECAKNKNKTFEFDELSVKPCFIFQDGVLTCLWEELVVIF